MEMDRCQLPMLDDTGLDDLKPHTHHALQGLHRLPGILDVVPPPVIWPTTPDEAQVSCLLAGVGLVPEHAVCRASNTCIVHHTDTRLQDYK